MVTKYEKFGDGYRPRPWLHRESNLIMETARNLGPRN